jgi:hypothetical protein
VQSLAAPSAALSAARWAAGRARLLAQQLAPRPALSSLRKRKQGLADIIGGAAAVITAIRMVRGRRQWVRIIAATKLISLRIEQSFCTFLPQNHELYNVQCRQLPSDVLGVFEPQFLRACVDSVNDSSHLAPGELRKVERTDPNGLKFIDWIGQESFVKAMRRPGRRTTLSQLRRTYELMRKAW